VGETPSGSAGGGWREAAHRGESAVALLSGGLDSGVALALWIAAGGRGALALTADYGQRAAAPEMAAARALAAALGVPWQSLDLRWLAGPAARAGSALVAAGPCPPRATAASPGDAETARAVWVPARNVVLCAAGAAFAEAGGAAWVLAGFNAEEARTFPDNSPSFVDAFSAALRHGCRAKVRLGSPTLALDKAGIVAAAAGLGLRAEQFWSCYDGGSRPCGRCESCARSARAWAGHSPR
jgi:7-cyano-7-deazaguanine synthase